MSVIVVVTARAVVSITEMVESLEFATYAVWASESTATFSGCCPTGMVATTRRPGSPNPGVRAPPSPPRPAPPPPKQKPRLRRPPDHPPPQKHHPAIGGVDLAPPCRIHNNRRNPPPPRRYRQRPHRRIGIQRE